MQGTLMTPSMLANANTSSSIASGTSRGSDYNNSNSNSSSTISSNMTKLSSTGISLNSITTADYSLVDNVGVSVLGFDPNGFVSSSDDTEYKAGVDYKSKLREIVSKYYNKTATDEYIHYDHKIDDRGRYKAKVVVITDVIVNPNMGSSPLALEFKSFTKCPTREEAEQRASMEALPKTAYFFFMRGRLLEQERARAEAARTEAARAESARVEAEKAEAVKREKQQQQQQQQQYLQQHQQMQQHVQQQQSAQFEIHSSSPAPTAAHNTLGDSDSDEPDSMEFTHADLHLVGFDPEAFPKDTVMDFDCSRNYRSMLDAIVTGYYRDTNVKRITTSVSKPDLRDRYKCFLTVQTDVGNPVRVFSFEGVDSTPKLAMQRAAMNAIPKCKHYFDMRLRMQRQQQQPQQSQQSQLYSPYSTSSSAYIAHGSLATASAGSHPQQENNYNYKNALQEWAQQIYRGSANISSVVQYKLVPGYSMGPFKSAVTVLLHQRYVRFEGNAMPQKKLSEQDAARVALTSGEPAFSSLVRLLPASSFQSPPSVSATAPTPGPVPPITPLTPSLSAPSASPAVASVSGAASAASASSSTHSSASRPSERSPTYASQLDFEDLSDIEDSFGGARTTASGTMSILSPTELVNGINYKNVLQEWAQDRYPGITVMNNIITYRLESAGPQGPFQSTVTVRLDTGVKDFLGFEKLTKKDSEQSAAKTALISAYADFAKVRQKLLLDEQHLVQQQQQQQQQAKQPQEQATYSDYQQPSSTRNADPFSLTSAFSTSYIPSLSQQHEQQQFRNINPIPSASVPPSSYPAYPHQQEPVLSRSCTSTISSITGLTSGFGSAPGVSSVLASNRAAAAPVAVGGSSRFPLNTNYKNTLQEWAQRRYRGSVDISNLIHYELLPNSSQTSFQSRVRVYLGENEGEGFRYFEGGIKSVKKLSEQDAARVALESGLLAGL